MLERDYIRRAGSRGDVVRVRFTTERGRVTVYTAQYEALVEGTSYPVVRYDSAHGRPHRNLLDWNGATVEKDWWDEFDLGVALNRAIDEIDDNWEAFRDSFLRRRP